VGFFTNEEYKTNSDGMVIHDSTWTYKIPTVDTIPKQFNVELINSARDRKRVLSSKGEPPLTNFHPHEHSCRPCQPIENRQYYNLSSPTMAD